MLKNKINSPTNLVKRDSFFFWAAISILCFTITAFALKVVIHPERLVRYTPLVTLHAVLMTLWLILFVMQAGLVRSGSVGIHRILGKLSLLLVIGFIASGLLVAFNFFVELDRPQPFIFNSFQMAIFVVLYLGALYAASIGRIDIHKRLMLIAVLTLLLQPYTRICNIVDVPEANALWVHWLVILVVPISYDLYTRRRVHMSTTIGIVVSFVLMGLALVLMSPLAEVMRSQFLG